MVSWNHQILSIGCIDIAIFITKLSSYQPKNSVTKYQTCHQDHCSWIINLSFIKDQLITATKCFVLNQSCKLTRSNSRLTSSTAVATADTVENSYFGLIQCFKCYFSSICCSSMSLICILSIILDPYHGLAVSDMNTDNFDQTSKFNVVFFVSDGFRSPMNRFCIQK